MIGGSPALQARRHSRPDSMHCMQLAGSNSIRPLCRATLASAVTTNHPRKTEKPGRDFPGVATAPLVLPVRSSRIHQGPGNARLRSQCVPQRRLASWLHLVIFGHAIFTISDAKMAPKVT